MLLSTPDVRISHGAYQPPEFKIYECHYRALDPKGTLREGQHGLDESFFSLAGSPMSSKKKIAKIKVLFKLVVRVLYYFIFARALLLDVC